MLRLKFLSIFFYFDIIVVGLGAVGFYAVFCLFVYFWVVLVIKNIVNMGLSNYV